MKKFTPTEKELMEAMWKTGGMTTNEIIIYFNARGKEWKRQTVNTFMSNLIEKEIIIKKNRKYVPRYSQVELKKKEAEDFLREEYDGSLKQFVAALHGGTQLSVEEAREVIALLDSLI